MGIILKAHLNGVEMHIDANDITNFKVTEDGKCVIIETGDNCFLCVDETLNQLGYLALIAIIDNNYKNKRKPNQWEI